MMQNNNFFSNFVKNKILACVTNCSIYCILILFGNRCEVHAQKTDTITLPDFELKEWQTLIVEDIDKQKRLVADTTWLRMLTNASVGARHTEVYWDRMSVASSYFKISDNQKPKAKLYMLSIIYIGHGNKNIDFFFWKYGNNISNFYTMDGKVIRNCGKKSMCKKLESLTTSFEDRYRFDGYIILTKYDSKAMSVKAIVNPTIEQEKVFFDCFQDKF